jgi:DNA polymerase-3 subunit epsilon
MREVVLDTETTGLDPLEGHRIIEIGCVELQNHMPTGGAGERRWLIDPERDVPDEAARVHGLTTAALRGQPVFAKIVDELLDFVADAPLVIHNAEFDIGFLNAELARLGRPALSLSRTINTLRMARHKFPGAPASLDALCKRFGIDLDVRDKHGALIDARLTAEVYINLLGGRQQGLAFAGPTRRAGPIEQARELRQPRPHAPSEAELAAHQAFVAKLKNPIWSQ